MYAVSVALCLSSYMMYSEKSELRHAANWPGVKAGSREQLMEQLQGTCVYMYLQNIAHLSFLVYLCPPPGFLPPSVMLPPHRLPQLLSQAVDLQVSRCPYHFERHPPPSSSHSSHHHYSLLSDHLCPRYMYIHTAHLFCGVCNVTSTHQNTLVCRGS